MVFYIRYLGFGALWTDVRWGGGGGGGGIHTLKGVAFCGGKLNMSIRFFFASFLAMTSYIEPTE